MNSKPSCRGATNEPVFDEAAVPASTGSSTLKPESFSQGDTVRLKSGGPVMTVQVRSLSLCYCVWLDDKSARKESVFEMDTLIKVEPPLEKSTGGDRSARRLS
jgi:uncharacterized protein YodC (DUF2158 family)